MHQVTIEQDPFPYAFDFARERFERYLADAMHDPDTRLSVRVDDRRWLAIDVTSSLSESEAASRVRAHWDAKVWLRT